MAFQAFKNIKQTITRRLNPMGQGVRVAQAPMKKIVKYGGPAFAALAAYFYGLGKAAFTGFVIGASIGGTLGAGVGGYLGLQLALATGPFAPIVGIVTVPLGAAAGGIVGATFGGIAGGLIGLGIAAGSTTLVSMGVGSGIGGLIGGYVGLTVGAATGTAVGTGLAALCIYVTLGACTPFAPFIVAGSSVTGATIGATLGTAVGSLIGAGAGYLFGKYVATPLTNAFKGAVSKIQGGGPGAPTGAGIPGSTTSGFFSNAASGLGNIVSGAGSFVWNGFTGLLGNAANLLGNFGGFITGLTSAEAATVTAAATPVAAAVGTVTAGTILVGSIILPAAFFSFEGEGGLPPTQGQNEFYSITKTANPNVVSNQPPGGSQQVLFTITLTARNVRLTNIGISDEIRIQGRNGNILTPPEFISALSSINCPTTLEPNTSCNTSATISIDSRFNDANILNTVTVKATPEGEPEKIDSSTAIITVGSPSSNCFIFQGSWSATDQSLENTAISTLARSPTYMGLLCSKGPIILNRINDNGFNTAVCPNIINITNIGVGTQTNTTYVLSHESGHMIQCSHPEIYQNFLSTNAWGREDYICSYPAGYSPPEDFAESIGIYTVWKDFVSRICGSINYPSKYPIHYQFVKTNLFGGFEY